MFEVLVLAVYVDVGDMLCQLLVAVIIMQRQVKVTYKHSYWQIDGLYGRHLGVAMAIQLVFTGPVHGLEI